MEEKGKIKKISAVYAEVVILKNRSECGSCKVCTTVGSSEMLVLAENKIGAVVGDTVSVGIGKFNALHYVPIYIFPIVFFILGYFVLPMIIPSAPISRELVGIIGAFSFGSLYFVAMYFVMRFLAKRNKRFAKIIAVIDNEEHSSC